MVRARAPQAGDYWAGCDAARAAGTAPIYRREPGYRSEMDGDSDGIACEPYRGN
ncbi:excalibur calcium-binding domain-containing protein [Sphingomonas sp. HH69]